MTKSKSSASSIVVPSIFVIHLVSCAQFLNELSLTMFHFLVTNLESFSSFNKFNIFLMFHYLYHSVTINEFKEKFRIVFCCFSETKNIVAPSSSSNFSTKLIC